MHHFYFYFTEEVLLFRSIHQAGLLLFVTGLKFNLKGACASKSGLNNILDFVEGHWRGEKSENGVLSMLEHVLNLSAE